jgi:hypothetical protein
MDEEVPENYAVRSKKSPAAIALTGLSCHQNAWGHQIGD